MQIKTMDSFKNFQEEFQEETGKVTVQGWTLYFNYINAKLLEQHIQELKELQYKIDELGTIIERLSDKMG